MLKLAWGAVSNALGGIYGYLAVGGLSLLLGCGVTYKIMHNANLASQTKAAQATVRLVEHQADITYQISMKFEGVKTNDAAQTEHRIEQIPILVSPVADSACVVPIGFVKLWNDAAHGPVPDAASGPDDAPSGVALSDVAKATVENDGTYDIVAHQLIALQDWVRQQGAAK